MRRMWPLGVVEVDPPVDHSFSNEPVGQFMQIYRLVFQRPPEAFDEDVVHAPTAPVYGDRNLRTLENVGEVKAGELAALVSIEDFRFVVGQQSSWNPLGVSQIPCAVAGVVFHV